MRKEVHLSDSAQEILEKYWIFNKEKKENWKLKISSDEAIASELLKAEFAHRQEDSLDLTDKGWVEARSCVRRHRLAECLLFVVLDVKKEKLHDLGCKFEHILQKDVEENICVLLGHPNTCPHGRPIPGRDCCKDNKHSLRKLVLPLSECGVNERGKVVYIKTHNVHTMNKLTAMGVLPGLAITLLQKTPAYLFQMGESQFAIDKTLAEKIQVRLSK